MVEYGKPPGNQHSLEKRLFAICGAAVLLIALGIRQCQGQKKQTASATSDERVKALEEKIKRLESRAQPEQQAPMLQTQVPSAVDLDSYKTLIDLENKKFDSYSKGFKFFLQDGNARLAEEYGNKVKSSQTMVNCLERYKSAAEPFYKANTACLSEANNTTSLP